jgi:hypothetical protein
MFLGHRIDTITLEREIYFLAVLFNASESLHKSDDNEDNDGIDRLRSHFETSEASRALVSVAVMLRNQMDWMRDEQVDLLLTKEARIVGSYSKPKVRDLSFRDACNKIIHVRDIEFDIHQTTPSRSGFLRPLVKLSGEFQGEEWTVKIDINRFIRVAYALS